MVISYKSHPTWVRGLKSFPVIDKHLHRAVAPHVGAWIEMHSRKPSPIAGHVAPHVGAWIEILPTVTRCTRRLSRTPRGCVD